MRGGSGLWWFKMFVFFNASLSFVLQLTVISFFAPF